MSDAFDSSLVGHTSENAREAFMATGDRVQQVGTIMGAEIIPLTDHSQAVDSEVIQSMQKGGSLIRNHPCKASYHSLAIDQTKAWRLLSFDPRRKKAQLWPSNGAPSAGFVIGSAAAINNFLGAGNLLGVGFAVSGCVTVSGANNMFTYTIITAAS